MGRGNSVVGDAGLEPTAFGSGDSPEVSDIIKEKAKKEGNSTS